MMAARAACMAGMIGSCSFRYCGVLAKKMAGIETVGREMFEAEAAGATHQH
jgi:hypothetical protein